MLDVFGDAKGLLKIDGVCIDNNAFRLNTKVTAAVLVALSLLVSARQYVGDPIDCIVDGGVPPHVIDSYCWLYSTFTVPEGDRAGRVGTDVVQPGVSPHVDGEDEVMHHRYYQWVCFVLLFQAACFYLPGYAWKALENGRIEALACDANRPMASDADRSSHKTLLVKYMTSHLHAHGVYAARFFACELLALVNPVVQIVLVDYFLDGEFTTYGMDALSFTELDQGDRVDPMARVFPKVTKCTFHKYGPSGTIQKLDSLCVLPLNVVNEKIYVFLWFWFWLVAAFGVLNMVYRVAVLTLPRFRLLLLRSRSRMSPVHELETIVDRCEIGDWFLLHQLSKNVDELVFQEFLSALARKWNNDDNDNDDDDDQSEYEFV